MYRNSQTTSTKCQYQAAASNPKWWFDEKCSVVCRRRHVVRNVVPIITCNPWNPVATKNVDPYAESAIVKGASIYSYACRAVKYSPNNTVKNNPWVACVALFSSRPWWDHVTVTPEASRIAVFSSGTCKGLNGWIPVGGQVDPSSIVGDRLEWKNAQKNDTKNRTSDTINRIIPHRSPVVTIFVCSPWYVPSRVTSRHHWIMVNTVMIAPIASNLSSYWWNHLINPIKVTIAPIAPVRGHGLLFTIWNGWFSCIDIS